MCLSAITLLMSCTSREPGSGPCELAFDYSIHTIDAEFGLSREEVGQSVNKAIGMWGDAIDSLHVNQTESGRVQIRFAYDERQSETNQAQQMEENIRSRQMRIGRMQEDHGRQEQRFEGMITEYQQHVEALNWRINEINDWINSRNQQGGFSDSDSDQFSRYRSEITQMENREVQLKERLENEMANLERLVEQINREINISNDLSNRLNDEFGTPRQFTGADFSGIEGEGVITVYHFRDRRELELVLAHEIGHALGLQHVSNTRSVMFETIGAQLYTSTLSLSREDRAEIRSKAGCRF